MGTVNDREQSGGQGEEGATRDPDEGTLRVGTKEDTREADKGKDDAAQEPRDNLRDGK